MMHLLKLIFVLFIVSKTHEKSYGSFSGFCSKSQLLAVVVMSETYACALSPHSLHWSAASMGFLFMSLFCTSVCLSITSETTQPEPLLLPRVFCVGLLKVSAHHLQLLLPASSIASQTNERRLRARNILHKYSTHSSSVTMLELDYACLNWRTISWTEGRDAGRWRHMTGTILYANVMPKSP